MAVHYWPQDPELIGRDRYRWGEVVGHGGVFSNVRDLARYVAWQCTGQSNFPVRRETLSELHPPVMPMEEGSPHAVTTGWFVYRFPTAVARMVTARRWRFYPNKK